MKKLLFATAGIMLGLSAMAGTNGLKSLQGGKGINNGFYLNLGLAFPGAVFKFNGYSTAQNMGIQPNLEIGNQWYFVKKEKMGFGIKVSWFQFGYSTYSPVAHVYNNGYPSNSIFSNIRYYTGPNSVSYSNRTSNIDLRFIKVAPQFTLGLNDDMAVDFSFEVSPTVMIGGNGETNKTYTYVAAGVLFAPGARFRYNKFAVGFDLGFGSLAYSESREVPDYYYVNGAGTEYKDVISNGRVSIFNPRIYLGFKF